MGYSPGRLLRKPSPFSMSDFLHLPFSASVVVCGMLFTASKQWRLGKVLKDVNKSKKGELKGASPHTVWVRDDLWEAVIQHKLHNEVSLRSVVEQGLLRFLNDANTKQPNTKEPTDAERWGNE